MFLCQKFGYTYGVISSMDKMDEVEQQFIDYVAKYMVFDTETTGLNVITDIPFLFTFGWGKTVYAIDLLEPLGKELLQRVYKMMALAPRVFAHNAKYDYHMLHNYKMPVPDHIQLADSQTIARLTNYSDEQMHKSLESMGEQYVDALAKFAGKIIKHKLAEINKRRKSEVKLHYSTSYQKRLPFGRAWELFEKRVQFVETEYDDILDFIGGWYQPATYLDVYREHPNLMTLYAIDDCVIMLEWLNKALPITMEVDPGLKVFNRECDLIRVIARLERVGFPADIDYLLESRVRVSNYRASLYKRLYEIFGVSDFSVGQEKLLKKLFMERYHIVLAKTDNQAMRKVSGAESAVEASKLIRKLRTVDKWLSTYINGALNKIVDGRVYTEIDNSGAVSGRVSCDMQQQPKEALMDDYGTELFHPRKWFLCDEGYSMYYFDYSQQELRVQAYYTILVSGGDKMLCRAYMPFKCVSIITGEPFDYKNPEVLKRWNSGEWALEEDDLQLWVPTDVHDETTFTAFPELNCDKTHKDFSHFRKLGKVCNFLKNYQGGKGAIMEQLDVDEEIADKLDKAYYATFPDIRKFQYWVKREMDKKGYVENLYGRRFYMRNARFFYKVGNYLVQGSSADMVKVVEIEVDKLLKGTKSSLILAVHDEIILRIHDDDVHLVPLIKKIMETVDTVPYVPMVSEVEVSTTNWAEKRKVRC